MKSLLVDALRQAAVNDDDQSLADTGTIDSAGEEFDATANDEQGSPDAEFELMVTTNSLVVAEAQTDETDDDTAYGERHAGQIANRLPALARTHAIRELARFSPLLCLIVAAMGAGGWISYQQVAATDNSTNLGAVVSGSRVNAGAAGIDTVNRTEATRFPFLIDGQVDSSEGILP